MTFRCFLMEMENTWYIIYTNNTMKGGLILLKFCYFKFWEVLKITIVLICSNCIINTMTIITSRCQLIYLYHEKIKNEFSLLKLTLSFKKNKDVHIIYGGKK